MQDAASLKIAEPKKILPRVRKKHFKLTLNNMSEFLSFTTLYSYHKLHEQLYSNKWQRKNNGLF